MSDNPFESGDNPYQAPRFTTDAGDIGGADPSLTGAAEMLRQTKPWVRFVSVMFFIGAAFMALAGLAMMAGGMITDSMPAPFGAILGLVYIVMALFYIAPAMFLWMYADRIGVFLRQQTPARLASALESQKSFWKFVGIMMLVVMCLYAIAIVVGVIAAVVG